MQPPLKESDEEKEASPLPCLPCCWICSKTNEDQSVLCHNCDISNGHAHIKCIVNQARAKNEKDYCNYKMATAVEDEKSLEIEYKSFKLMLEEPWLKCGRCGENYCGSTEKLLADEFFEYYKNRGGRDIRTCIAVFAQIKAHCWNLGKNKWSKQPYKKIQLFKQVVESNNQANEAKVFTRFKIQIENDIAICMSTAEFYLPPKTIPKPPEAACWICLDDEPDEHGESLERTCACRGSSGYCHINCIANFAAQKNTTFMQRMMTGMSMSADESSKELSVPWTQCPTCNQDYTGTFAWRLAGNFSMQYDSYPYNELRRQVSIETLSRVFLETSQYDMGIGAMKKEINLIRTMRKELRTDGKIASRFWLNAGDLNTQDIEQRLCDDDIKYCVYLISFYKAKGETKLANDVLRELKIMGVETFATSDKPGVDGSLQFSIEDMLNDVKVSPDKSVKWRKAEIKRLTKEFGKDAPKILDHKFSLSQELMQTKSVKEGIVLMFEVVGDANRILGPEHPQTVQFTKYSTMVTQSFSMSSGKKTPRSSNIIPPQTKARLISDIPALNGKEVNAVRYTKDGKKLIVDFLEPIPNKPNRVKIPPDQLVFGLQTIVMTPGKKFGMISSFDTETKKYSVMPLGKIATERYKQNELVILFQALDTQKGALV